MSKELTTVEEKPLTAEDLKFCSLVAKGYSAIQSYRMAYPAKKNLAYSTARVNASLLLAKHNISTEVATRVETATRLARLAEVRIEDILINDNSQRKGNKVADVAMFMYEQANGKAVQKTVVEGKHILVTYDLSGGQAGSVPQEILDQLEED